MPDEIMTLPVRFCRLGRLYGPGMPDLGPEGLMEKPLVKTLGQVAIVSVHCWNLGEKTGPYPIEAGDRCPGRAADWVPKAHEIIRDRIAPAMQAARDAGVTIFHVAQSTYANRYETFRSIAEDPEFKAPQGPPRPDGCVRARGRDERWEDQYGPDYPGPAWITHTDAFDIAEAVRPVGDEPVVLTGRQLNGLCRRKDIDTLFYVGFMADICLLNVPGAVREMSETYGYRCVVLRDCTTAYEFEDTMEGEWMTRAAIRSVESGTGYSTTSSTFIEAVEDAQR
jgi:nicotinamidase-related amidase